MKSLRELYRIGKGPSSSHTIGPERACRLFLHENPAADSFQVVLYGSLEKTGIGQGTDAVIKVFSLAWRLYATKVHSPCLIRIQWIFLLFWGIKKSLACEFTAWAAAQSA